MPNAARVPTAGRPYLIAASGVSGRTNRRTPSVPRSASGAARGRPDAPPAEQEERRDQGQLEEDVEEEDVERQERADGPGLEEEQPAVERAGPVLHGLPRDEDRRQHHQAAQGDEPDVEPVDAEEELDPRAGPVGRQRGGGEGQQRPGGAVGGRAAVAGDPRVAGDELRDEPGVPALPQRGA